MKRGSCKTDLNGFPMQLSEAGDGAGEHIGEFAAGRPLHIITNAAGKKWKKVEIRLDIEVWSDII